MNYFKSIVILTLVSGLLFLAFTILPVEIVYSRKGEQASKFSCLAPVNPEISTQCDRMEKEILRSTVRFQFDYWVVKSDESGYIIQNSIGHGTIKDGRYLVTHNHFSQPFLDQPQVNSDDIYTQIKIYNANGDLLTGLSKKDVSIVVQEQQTLVLDFGEENGLGFFTSLGLVSADFRDAYLLPLEPGSEVAQIDWDGAAARIDWATIQEVQNDQGMLSLVMSDHLKIGASGGGVFFQGVHVANNWQTAPVGGISTAVLNSSWVN
jgi:hypothetical protein